VLSDVSFRELLRSGHTKKCRAPLDDFVRRLPYLMSGGLIPPLSVLNEVLALGEIDAGMSGSFTWAPFKLTAGEHTLLVKALETSNSAGRPLKYEEPPEWVSGRSDWSAWISSRTLGIPLEENLRLRRRMDELQDRMDSAEKSGDESARVQYLCQLSEVSIEWSEFVNRHRRDVDKQ
jgi:hypothetical protein